MTARTRSRAAALAALALVVAAVMVVRGGGDHPYRIYATFSDASGLLKNYNVKVGGVPAGSIKDVRLDGQDHAVVAMDLDKGAYPIGAGATARIRPVNLLGEKYVDLDPGRLDEPQPSGTHIPLARTGTPTELDDVLNMLDPGTRGRLRIMLNEAGLGLAGRGHDLGATLAQLPPALDKAREVVGQVAAQNTALRAMIRRGDDVLVSFAHHRGDLNQLVDSAASSLSNVAARRVALGRTVSAAPGALGQLQSTLGALQTTSAGLRPAARSLRAAAAPLASALRDVPAFTDQASGALDAVRDVSPTLGRLGRDATPTVRRLDPTAARLKTFGGSLDTLTNALDEKRALKSLLTFIEGWAGVIGQQDALGSVFRIRVTISHELITSLLDRMTAEAKSGARRHGRHRPLLGAGTRPGPVRIPRPPIADRVLGPVIKTVTDLGPKVARQVETTAGDTVRRVAGGGPASGDGRDGSADQLLDYLLK